MYNIYKCCDSIKLFFRVSLSLLDLCSICGRRMTGDSISCNSCKSWVHSNCNLLSKSDYDLLVNSDDLESWWCLKCICGDLPEAGCNDLRDLDLLIPILDKINGEGKITVLLGDFNIDLLKKNESNVEKIIDSLSSYSLNPYITFSTRFNLTFKTLIEIKEWLGKFEDFVAKSNLGSSFFFNFLWDENN